MGSRKLHPPAPGDPHDAAREAHHIAATEEFGKTLGGLIDTLAQFRPLTIYDQSGLVVKALARRVGRDFSIGFPFQCFDAGVSAHDSITLVYLHSHLLRSIRVTDFVTMTGLNFPFRVIAGDRIWLEITLENGLVTAAEVKHGPNGWTNFPEPVAFEGDFPSRLQTKAYVMIAYAILHNDATEYDPPGVILGTGSSAIMLVNVLRNHLLMASTCYMGDSVLYPMPWSGAFIRNPV